MEGEISPGKKKFDIYIFALQFAAQTITLTNAACHDSSHPSSDNERMKCLNTWSPQEIQFVFTDIDDTLTTDGKLSGAAYQALWNLRDKGWQVIPVTGRPAGWCEMIARQWPVAAVVGENGGFYFRYDENTRSMKRHFYFTAEVQIKNRLRLDQIRRDVMTQVPGAALASDQFTRLMDLAIDFCEDVEPLPPSEVKKIVEIFQQHGAQAKVSSIHVNGWYGDYNKLSMCEILMQKEFGLSKDNLPQKATFIGDSPNDEPMFAYFEHSVAVKNLEKFRSELKSLPKYICQKSGGEGFAEFAQHLISQSSPA